MSGEGDVGAARRAVAELTAPGSTLLAELAGAETLPQQLEPNLLLLGLDVFGAITVPVRGGAAGERNPGGRTAPPVEPATPAPRRREAPGSASASPAEAASPVLPVGRGSARRGAPAAGESDAGPASRLLELFGGAPATGGAGHGVEPDAAKAALGGIANTTARSAAAASLLGPLGRAGGVGGTTPPSAPATPASALELIARLTQSILARAVEAGAQGRAASRPPPPRPGAAAPRELSDFLQETLGSLGRAPARVQQAAGEPSAQGEAVADVTAGTAPPSAAAPPQTQEGAPAASVTGADERGSDPETVAALVNDALVEQARRHGLELG